MRSHSVLTALCFISCVCADSEADEDSEAEDDPTLDIKTIPHRGDVNRIRVCHLRCSVPVDQCRPLTSELFFVFCEALCPLRILCVECR